MDAEVREFLTTRFVELQEQLDKLMTKIEEFKQNKKPDKCPLCNYPPSALGMLDGTGNIVRCKGIFWEE